MLVLLFPSQSFHPRGEIPEDWQRSLSYTFHGHGRCQTQGFVQLSRTSTTPTAMLRAGGNLATVCPRSPPVPLRVARAKLLFEEHLTMSPSQG